MTPASAPPPGQANELWDLVRGAVILLGTGLVVFGAEALIGNPVLGLVVGFLAVDFVARRIGATFGEGDFYRQVAIGFGLGAGIALFVALLAVATGLATLRLGSPSFVLLLGLGRSLVAAFRDEVLYRGIPLTLARRVDIPDGYTVVFTALLGAAPLVGAPTFRFEAVLLAFAAGLFFASLFRAGWGRIAFLAHAGWLFLADVAFRGALLDVVFSKGNLGPFARSSGLVAYLAAFVFAVAAVGVNAWRRKRGG